MSTATRRTAEIACKRERRANWQAREVGDGRVMMEGWGISSRGLMIRDKSIQGAAGRGGEWMFG